jgi:hypothetical protein
VGCSIRDLVKYPISQLEGLLYEEIKNVEEKVTNTKKLWELLNEMNENVKEKDRYISNKKIHYSNRFVLQQT